MSRKFPSWAKQVLTHTLRNRICVLGTPQSQASTSSHLRNFAVAEVIGLVGQLDGHPLILKPAATARKGADHQSASGTRPNPLTHAIPCSLLFNGQLLEHFYTSGLAIQNIARIFGMGTMAPENWNEQGTFSRPPGELNKVDNKSERIYASDGLAAAFEKSVDVALNDGRWDGSGVPRHDFKSLSEFVAGIYSNTWVPLAGAAYAIADANLRRDLAAVANSDAQKRHQLQVQKDLLDLQVKTLLQETTVSTEAVANVWKFTRDEPWLKA